MSAMKVTISAAMRARDVSRPHAEHLAWAEEAEASAVRGRPAVADAAVPVDAAVRVDAGLAGRADAAGPVDASLAGRADAAGPDAEMRRDFRGDRRQGRPGARRRWRPRGSERGRPSH